MPNYCCTCMAWVRRLVLAVCALIALAGAGTEELLAGSPGESGIAEKTWTFDIPPQAVTSALRNWSAVTGRDWAYLGDSLEGVRSPGVTGRLTGREALDRLLAGTGLSYVILPGGGISIVRASAGKALLLMV